MQLYYSPGACSLASHIALEELGQRYTAVKVNLMDKKTEDGADFSLINSKGYVPALKLNEGALLTESTALLGYLGELNPGAGLIPPAGTLGNFRVREWLGFISTELHKTVGPLFRPGTAEATASAARELLTRRLGWLSEQLGAKAFLTGDQFTVADAYLFTVLNWMGHLAVDLNQWPNLKALHARAGVRPAVQRALKAEGLLK